MLKTAGDWIRSDWAGLAIISGACLLKGVTYLPFAVDDGAVPAVERWIPMWLAMSAWLIIGAAGLLAVAARAHGAVMVGAGTAIHALWGMMYLTAWLTGGSPRGYVTAILYLAFALLVVWAYARGARDEVTVRIRKE